MKLNIKVNKLIKYFSAVQCQLKVLRKIMFVYKAPH
jgi:hypothetical protein